MEILLWIVLALVGGVVAYWSLSILFILGLFSSLNKMNSETVWEEDSSE